MSDRQTIMKFELLPNEIIIECFEYLNACDIFHSFDQLNDHFNHLIRHIPLCLNFKDVKKSIFNEFCTKMLLNSEIKNQVYSLYLPHEYECFQTRIFFSFFSYEEFSNLQNFDSTSSLSPHRKLLWKKYEPEVDAKIKQADLLFSKLRKLSTSSLNRFLYENHEISSITNLTLARCGIDDFYWLVKHVPMLKYIHINHVEFCEYEIRQYLYHSQRNLHLKQLIIDQFNVVFEGFKMFVKPIPNLKSLTISGSNNKSMIDACQWEQLIRTSLPYLDTFKFKFNYWFGNGNDDIVLKFKQFQTDFWQEQHHWFTEYLIEEKSASIYTIFYCSNTFILSPNVKRYCNYLKNSVNTFIHVTNLTIGQELITKNCEFYFSNVTHLTLIRPDMSFWVSDKSEVPTSNIADFHSLIQPMCRSLITEHVKYLKMIVNLSNLKYLNITEYVTVPISSLILLEIFKYAPQLFSLIITWDQLISCLEDDELCKYLNKMIKQLHIGAGSKNIISNSFNVKQFCEIFSNIAHLQCIEGHTEKLLFVLHSLPKLSTVYLEWKTENKPENLSEFEQEAQKQNIMCDIKINYIDRNHFNRLHRYELFGDDDGFYYTSILMWFDKSMSELHMLP